LPLVRDQLASPRSGWLQPLGRNDNGYLSLPSNLVEQRPDIRMAEEQLHAASAQVGIAVANILPNISLTANIGSAANRATNLFATGTGFWSLAASIAQPVFQGGALLRRKRAAEANFDQAAATYRGTVITAIQNVADSLRALQHDADALKAAATAEDAARRSLEISRRRVELGDISYLALLSAEQTYQQAVLTLVPAQAGRLGDTAALFQALGGGWWNRKDVASSDPAIGGNQ
jgi:NodT family efflux transporter outer membrane factor (OMF) lipoprotein